MALLNDDLYRHVGNWRKCIHDCERAKRASRFFFISALILLNYYIVDKSLFVSIIIMSLSS